MSAARTVLVTGAARRLGATIARHLAGQGWRVAIHHHHSADDADALAAELPGATVLSGDLADPEVPAVLVAAARAAFGGPLVALVNSASLFDYDTPPEITAASLRAHGVVNLEAPVLLASALAAQDDLVAGAVVNILDQKVANLNPDFFSYSCGKIALTGATTMLAQALRPRVRVNAVSPGLSLPSADQSEAEFVAAASKNLLQRPVDPADIARAVGFLLEADGLEGQNLFVDCGQHFLKRDRDVMFEGRA
ncbi:SDR family oxidoreductase [Sphingomonas glacialis]|uniref:SDR family oxidoreductase n=1 Tax=Sphingomonas glacialis TaxID=658225 RepID=A0A502FXX5_9SPHN|nr:SDR family oxidoreductase [Sphingomonas glacialis]TPG54368.1 SDR family oxidoreductase [Sphingomonas glacialis]